MLCVASAAKVVTVIAGPKFNATDTAFKLWVTMFTLSPYQNENNLSTLQ